MSAGATRSPAALRKRRRLYAVSAGLVMLAVATALVLAALGDSVVFFYSPSDVKVKQVKAEQRIRLGGLVAEGSVKKASDGLTTRFVVTDLNETVPVAFKGVLPDLFREGQGVVAEGAFRPDGLFVATEVLAKHDENYMPPEVAEALKRSGQWKPAAPKKP
jgi:cytochrome c-type biogenesis protein CcmE